MGGIADVSDEPGDAVASMVDSEVVEQGSEEPIGSSTADHDLVAGWFGHDPIITTHGMTWLHPGRHLTRVRSQLEAVPVIEGLRMDHSATNLTPSAPPFALALRSLLAAVPRAAP